MINSNFDDHEWTRRRQIRLLQVRKQSNEIARQVRERVLNEVRKRAFNKEKEFKHKLEMWKAQRLNDLEQLYRNAVTDFGEAHRTAIEEQSANETYLVRQKDYLTKAKKRGESAIEQELREKRLAAKEKMIPLQRKLLTRKIEDIRSTLVCSIAVNQTSSFASVIGENSSDTKSYKGHNGRDSAINNENVYNKEHKKQEEARVKKCRKSMKPAKPSPKKLKAKKKVSTKSSDKLKNYFINKSDLKLDLSHENELQLNNSKPSKINYWINLDKVEAWTEEKVENYEKARARSESSIRNKERSEKDNKKLQKFSNHEISKNKRFKAKDSEQKMVECFGYSLGHDCQYRDDEIMIKKTDGQYQPDANELALMEEEDFLIEKNLKERRIALTEKRGNKAFEKEKISRNYDELMSKLKKLTTKEKLIKSYCQIHTPNFFMSDDRRQEKYARRQRIMNSKFESLYCEVMGTHPDQNLHGQSVVKESDGNSVAANSENLTKKLDFNQFETILTENTSSLVDKEISENWNQNEWKIPCEKVWIKKTPSSFHCKRTKVLKGRGRVVLSNVDRILERGRKLRREYHRNESPPIEIKAVGEHPQTNLEKKEEIENSVHRGNGIEKCFDLEFSEVASLLLQKENNSVIEQKPLSPKSFPECKMSFNSFAAGELTNNFCNGITNTIAWPVHCITNSKNPNDSACESSATSYRSLPPDIHPKRINSLLRILDELKGRKGFCAVTDELIVKLEGLLKILEQELQSNSDNWNETDCHEFRDNPRLNHYITKLLDMSREKIAELSVYSGSGCSLNKYEEDDECDSNQIHRGRSLNQKNDCNGTPRSKRLKELEIVMKRWKKILERSLQDCGSRSGPSAAGRNSCGKQAKSSVPEKRSEIHSRGSNRDGKCLSGHDAIRQNFVPLAPSKARQSEQGVCDPDHTNRKIKAEGSSSKVKKNCVRGIEKPGENLRDSCKQVCQDEEDGIVKTAKRYELDSTSKQIHTQEDKELGSRKLITENDYCDSETCPNRYPFQSQVDSYKEELRCHSGDTSMESFPDVMEELLKRNMITSPFHWSGGRRLSGYSSYCESENVGGAIDGQDMGKQLKSPDKYTLGTQTQKRPRSTPSRKCERDKFWQPYICKGPCQVHRPVCHPKGPEHQKGSTNIASYDRVCPRQPSDELCTPHKMIIPPSMHSYPGSKMRDQYQSSRKMETSGPCKMMRPSTPHPNKKEKLKIEEPSREWETPHRFFGELSPRHILDTRGREHFLQTSNEKSKSLPCRLTNDRKATLDECGESFGGTNERSILRNCSPEERKPDQDSRDQSHSSKSLGGRKIQGEIAGNIDPLKAKRLSSPNRSPIAENKPPPLEPGYECVTPPRRKHYKLEIEYSPPMPGTRVANADEEKCKGYQRVIYSPDKPSPPSEKFVTPPGYKWVTAKARRCLFPKGGQEGSEDVETESCTPVPDGFLDQAVLPNRTIQDSLSNEDSETQKRRPKRKRKVPETPESMRYIPGFGLWGGSWWDEYKRHVEESGTSQESSGVMSESTWKRIVATPSNDSYPCVPEYQSISIPDIQADPQKVHESRVPISCPHAIENQEEDLSVSDVSWSEFKKGVTHTATPLQSPMHNSYSLNVSDPYYLKFWQGISDTATPAHTPLPIPTRTFVDQLSPESLSLIKRVYEYGKGIPKRYLYEPSSVYIPHLQREFESVSLTPDTPPERGTPELPKFEGPESDKNICDTSYSEKRNKSYEEKKKLWWELYGKPFPIPPTAEELKRAEEVMRKKAEEEELQYEEDREKGLHSMYFRPVQDYHNKGMIMSDRDYQRFLNRKFTPPAPNTTPIGGGFFLPMSEGSEGSEEVEDECSAPYGFLDQAIVEDNSLIHRKFRDSLASDYSERPKRKRELPDMNPNESMQIMPSLRRFVPGLRWDKRKKNPTLPVSEDSDSDESGVMSVSTWKRILPTLLNDPYQYVPEYHAYPPVRPDPGTETDECIPYEVPPINSEKQQHEKECVEHYKTSPTSADPHSGIDKRKKGPPLEPEEECAMPPKSGKGKQYKLQIEYSPPMPGTRVANAAEEKCKGYQRVIYSPDKNARPPPDNRVIPQYRTPFRTPYRCLFPTGEQEGSEGIGNESLDDGPVEWEKVLEKLKCGKAVSLMHYLEDDDYSPPCPSTGRS